MTFKDLPTQATFTAEDSYDIVVNRGDRSTPRDYGSSGKKLKWQKRDDFGGHILYEISHDYRSSVYYRIEPDTPVEVI